MGVAVRKGTLYAEKEEPFQFGNASSKCGFGFRLEGFGHLRISVLIGRHGDVDHDASPALQEIIWKVRRSVFSDKKKSYHRVVPNGIIFT